jgi:hypothetical protein
LKRSPKGYADSSRSDESGADSARSDTCAIGRMVL